MEKGKPTRQKDLFPNFKPASHALKKLFNFIPLMCKWVNMLLTRVGPRQQRHIVLISGNKSEEENSHGVYKACIEEFNVIIRFSHVFLLFFIGNTNSQYFLEIFISFLQES